VLPQPTQGQLTASVVAPPSVSLKWTGGAGVNHYDLYRSAAALQLGQKINVAPLVDSGSPNYTVTVTDDGISTTSAPAVGTPLYYRLVAADALGNYGPVSDGVGATIEASSFVQDAVLATLVAGLRADATLMAMLGNDPNQVRFQKRIRETGDLYPFVVLWRSDWKEDPKFKDLRMGTLEYTISVVNNASSSIVVTNVLNRIAKLLDGDAGKFLFNGSSAIQVMSTMYMGAGPESYTDSPKLWFQDGRLRIICQLFAT